jgi:hypothetical protein
VTRAGAGTNRPRTLVLWDRYDASFRVEEAAGIVRRFLDR